MDRSVLELVVTVIPFAALWLLMWGTLSAGSWLGLLFAAPAARFLVSLFMIQHDCSHGSFFRSRRTNDWVGRAIGRLALRQSLVSVRLGLWDENQRRLVFSAEARTATTDMTS